MTDKPNIYARLRSVQVELKAPKTQTGRFGKSRNAEAILEQVKPLLEKYELTLLMDMDVLEISGKNYVKCTARVADHSDNSIFVSALAWEGEISRGLDAPQVTGAATSYARKYALSGLFAIDDSKDDPDGHTEPAEHVAKPAATTKAEGGVDDRPTKNQLGKLTNVASDLELDDNNTSEFFQDAIGKPRPTTKEDFAKAIEFGEAILADRADSAKEIASRS